MAYANGRYIHGVPFYKWRYWAGPQGIGVYSVQSDSAGWYHFGYCKPVGQGARKGKAKEFLFVPAKAGRRRKRKDARARAYKLAFGIDFEEKFDKKVTHTEPGSGYCTKCRKTVIIAVPTQAVAKNDRSIIVGQCPLCGNQIQRYGRMIDCPGCDEYREAKADDYLCLWCRLAE